MATPTGPALNVAVTSNIAPEYAPAGRALIAAACPAAEVEGELLATAVQHQLRRWWGPQGGGWVGGRSEDPRDRQVLVKADANRSIPLFVIEGGVAGGSALQQASQRRATADRLLVEAAWLEALAADERSMAVHLANLPPPYAIMHDLRLPGSKGNIDHLIVGPGGAFVVLTRRCTEAVTFREGQLWAGDLPLRDTLDAAKVESQLLTQSLATPVVPIVALLGVVLPVAAPRSIENVLVCAGENVVRVVTRGSHTLLASHKVSEVAERALPLLHNAGSVARTESALGVRADPAPDTSVRPVIPPSARASAESVEHRKTLRRESLQRASKSRRGGATAAPGGAGDRARPGGMAEPQPAKPPKERSSRARSLGFIAAVIVSLCLAAVALGSLVRLIWSDDAPGRDPSAPSTTASSAPETTHRDALAASLTAPTVAFTSTCPAAGAGWQLQPVWPGDLVGLVNYQIEIQSLDGTWSQLPPLATPQSQWDSLPAQPANAAYTVRITAVMSDGSRSVSAPTVISAPSTPC